MTRRNERRQVGAIRALVLAAVLLMLAMLTACALMPPETGDDTPSEPERVDTGFIVTGPDSYDSADTAVLVDRNEKEDALTFFNTELEKRYTLSMDGTTKLYDKYGESISAAQLQKGDIVDITFLRSQKHLTSLKFSAEAWSYTDVENYEINSVRGEVSIGSEVYKMASATHYFVDDMEIEQLDINPADVLSFYGIGNQVLSVRVERGHGYLRLANDENFLGGWIEVGQAVIQRITEDMLLLVPEGSYQVNISHKGGEGVKDVIINRNEETTLDIGDLTVPEPQYGMVLFSVDPSYAELYIDGAEADISAPVSLEYGLHQIIARAEGYQSVTRYIRVAQESAGVNVPLTPNSSEEDDESSSSSSPQSSSTDAVTDYYKVYIDAPEGAEVYLDGNYVGISPCSFRKAEGSHVITLRKTGYITRSYTVQIDSEKKDISFSFAELVKDGQEEESGIS